MTAGGEFLPLALRPGQGFAAPHLEARWWFAGVPDSTVTR